MVRPKVRRRWRFVDENDPLGHESEELVTMPYNNPDGLIIECEVVQPPSQVGRTVYVLLDTPDLVTHLLREAKAAAIRTRSRPMASGA